MTKLGWQDSLLSIAFCRIILPCCLKVEFSKDQIILNTLISYLIFLLIILLV